ncbi:MAG: secondary thiamine-phosphate synthase enzyme YjbQ, partial [Myxococcales bacterium]
TELIDITDRVAALVRASGMQEGLCTVFCPHTTGAITINENADPDVKDDLLAALERIVPNRGFKHAEGNSDSHVKASLVGPSVTILIEGGALRLGTWQGVYFCEFDGPRRRKVWVQILP